MYMPRLTRAKRARTYIQRGSKPLRTTLEDARLARTEGCANHASRGFPVSPEKKSIKRAGGGPFAEVHSRVGGDVDAQKVAFCSRRAGFSREVHCYVELDCNNASPYGSWSEAARFCWDAAGGLEVEIVGSKLG